jgi:hypothetical protein
MRKIGPLNPPQFDVFRVMVRYKPKGEFEMFDEYSDRQVAEDLAKELVASRRVIKSEVIRPHAGPNSWRVATYWLAGDRIEKKSGNNVVHTVGWIGEEAETQSEHEKELAEMKERQRLFAVHQKEQHEKKLERLLNALAMKEQRPYREPLAFGLRDLAEATDLSVAYLRQEIYQGRLVSRKAGSRLLVRIEHAREWLYKLPLARPEATAPGVADSEGTEEFSRALTSENEGFEPPITLMTNK